MIFIPFQINHIIFCNDPNRYLYDKSSRYTISLNLFNNSTLNSYYKFKIAKIK